MWNSKTLEIQRTFSKIDLKFLNFKNLLPHINGV
jgi:hypothetical protein